MNDLRGQAQGMGLFHVEIGGETKQEGWQGSLAGRYPTFYVVGATEADAIENALAVTGLSVGATIPGGATVVDILVTVVNADHDAPYVPTRRRIVD